jgi:hypothetical protein
MEKQGKEHGLNYPMQLTKGCVGRAALAPVPGQQIICRITADFWLTSSLEKGDILCVLFESYW